MHTVLPRNLALAGEVNGEVSEREGNMKASGFVFNW